jgi:alcohol dehydrogenase (cytochrome c)
MRAALAVLAAASLWAQTDGGATRADWPHYGGLPSSWRYSALDQVTAANVSKLTPVWAFSTGDIAGGLQATPIVVDGVLYLSSSNNNVFAMDAATGKELWQYRYALPKSFTTFYGPWNRGLAVGHGRVFVGTLDNYVVGLDAKTGRELWKTNVEDANQCGCNITAAPLIVKDKVIVGVTGGDSAHRGYITAFDAKTGRQAWRFWTIPGPGEPGNDTWLGDSWKHGGGSSWMTGSYDPDLNLVYWSVGNPAADFYGDSRKGRNLYTDSVVALDADTGKLKWYHQQIPHDVWDFDTAYENILLDLPVNGRPRKLLLNVNKSGVVFVVDRTNGEFISGYPLTKHMNWIKGISPKGELLGRNEPPEGKTSFICPAIGGGRSWNHAAYSPRTKLLYTTAIEWCQDVTVFKEDPQEGQTFFGATFVARHPKGEEAHGHIDAVDPVSGKKTWSMKFKYPMLASILATAGDVIFTGDPEGNFLALDARTGKQLWSYQTGSGHRGSSITYSVQGRQYIATPSGWGSAVAGLMAQLWPEVERFRSASTLWVFALPEVGR